MTLDSTALHTLLQTEKDAKLREKVWGCSSKSCTCALPLSILQDPWPIDFILQAIH